MLLIKSVGERETWGLLSDDIRAMLSSLTAAVYWPQLSARWTPNRLLLLNITTFHYLHTTSILLTTHKEFLHWSEVMFPVEDVVQLHYSDVHEMDMTSMRCYSLSLSLFALWNIMLWWSDASVCCVKAVVYLILCFYFICDVSFVEVCLFWICFVLRNSTLLFTDLN